MQRSASPAFHYLTQGTGDSLWVNLSGLRLEVTLNPRRNFNSETYEFGAVDLAEMLATTPLFGSSTDTQLLAALRRKGMSRVPMKFTLGRAENGDHAGKPVVTITIDGLADFSTAMVVPIPDAA